MKLAIECFLPLGLWGHLIREKGDNYYPVSYASFIEDLKHVTEGYKWKLLVEQSISRKDKPAEKAGGQKSVDDSL